MGTDFSYIFFFKICIQADVMCSCSCVEEIHPLNSQPHNAHKNLVKGKGCVLKKFLLSSSFTCVYVTPGDFLKFQLYLLEEC